jgi:hypothetical protein
LNLLKSFIRYLKIIEQMEDSGWYKSSMNIVQKKEDMDVAK